MDGTITKPRIALALSGGGFRASIFHLGMLRRIAELGWLPRIDVISTVSGGSIIGAFLALRWNELLRTGADGPAFEQVVVRPFLEIVQKRNFLVDWVATSWQWPFRKLASKHFTRTEAAAETFDRMFYAGSYCNELPEHPLLIMNATNLQTIRAWRFTRWGMGDSRVGHASWDGRPFLLSRCVGASAAFPPVFPPARILKGDYSFSDPIYGEAPLKHYPLIPLTDGGVYDNAGLEAVVKPVLLPGLRDDLEIAEFLIVSDGGAPGSYTFNASGIPAISDALLLYRVDEIARAQVSALRTRSLMADFVSGRRGGILVSLSSKIQNMPVAQYSDYCQRIDRRFQIPAELLPPLKRLRTSLDRFSEIEIEALMYHAYSMTTAFLWCYRQQFPEPYRVDDELRDDGLVEFTKDKVQQWQTVLSLGASSLRLRLPNG